MSQFNTSSTAHVSIYGMSYIEGEGCVCEHNIKRNAGVEFFALNANLTGCVAVDVTSTPTCNLVSSRKSDGTADRMISDFNTSFL